MERPVKIFELWDTDQRAIPVFFFHNQSMPASLQIAYERKDRTLIINCDAIGFIALHLICGEAPITADKALQIREESIISYQGC
ncbi:hypothetical protein PM082_024085 [Marasmius tenuissimus]|nr:hypothetical protein PM082_024085 [Marasmius tenuissimus]